MNMVPVPNIFDETNLDVHLLDLVQVKMSGVQPDGTCLSDHLLICDRTFRIFVSHRLLNGCAETHSKPNKEEDQAKKPPACETVIIQKTEKPME